MENAAFDFMLWANGAFCVAFLGMVLMLIAATAERAVPGWLYLLGLVMGIIGALGVIGFFFVDHLGY